MANATYEIPSNDATSPAKVAQSGHEIRGGHPPCVGC